MNPFILSLAKGPSALIKTYPGYYINGYKFHTLEHGSQRSTMNSGVCIKGETYGTDTQELDFYGRLLEVCELEYPGLPTKTTTLFRCEWFDPSRLGLSIHSEYKLVSVNHTRRYNKFEPFILANQAIQVYYCAYPSLKQSMKEWWEVCKIKARSNVEVSDESSASIVPSPFQEDALGSITNVVVDEDTTLVHPDGTLIDIEETSDNEDDEVELSESEDNHTLDDDDDDDDE